MSVSKTLLSGGRVLLVWHGGHSPEAVQSVVKGLREEAGDKATVLLEHADRLNMGIVMCVSINLSDAIILST